MIRAEYTHKGAVKTFSVEIEQREDGTAGPAYRRMISERSCPHSAATVRALELDHYDAVRDVAVYRVASA